MRHVNPLVLARRFYACAGCCSACSACLDRAPLLKSSIIDWLNAGMSSGLRLKYQVAIDDDLLIDVLCPGVSKIGLERRP